MELLSITRHGNMMVLLLLVLWSCRWIPMQVSGRKGTTFADSTVDPKPNVSRIGALFTVNSVIGRTARPAILDAIDDVNANTSILPHTKLELILHDTDCSGFLGIAEVLCQYSKFRPKAKQLDDEEIQSTRPKIKIASFKDLIEFVDKREAEIKEILKHESDKSASLVVNQSNS
ncbi:hypothetical protein Ahy_B08g093744 [Arachis hypogaea]|uniref:Receptor ligand binding region domain-containing protein n=1 Tax=Arachis hypogaea TaxID=3818 RepID=A0A444Y6V1_ARAHY|nr:hypothetical protein Ahy_B08g093744 [Arachis hypogaea]